MAELGLDFDGMPPGAVSATLWHRFGFRVWVSGLGFGFGVQGLGFRVWGARRRHV